MKILAVIPARAGSKGIPNKNIRIINGKPLISYCIEKALKSKYITDIIVTTDSPEIELLANYYGVSCIHRKKELCGDEVTLDSVIYDACKEYTGDYVITLQPTSPTLEYTTLDKAIEYMIQKHLDTLLSVVNKPHLAWVEKSGKVVPDYQERLNRQYMPKRFLETGAFLISKKEIVTEETRIGEKVDVFEISEREAVDVDSFQDLIVVEQILKERRTAIIVDGNNQIGMGHVCRVLELADIFSYKPDIYFNKNITDVSVFGSTMYPLFPYSNENELIESLGNNEYQLVINDILDTDAEYVEKIKALKTNPRVVNFEDLGTGSKHADMVINALYVDNEEQPNKAYCGEKYYLMPKIYMLYKPIHINSRVENIFICFGGADPQNYTEKMINIIRKEEYKDITFRIVLGKAKKNYKQLIERNQQENVEIFYDVKNMPELMTKSDIAVTSRGRTCYELAVLGIPTIAMAQNEREERHQFVCEKNGFYYLGRDVEEGTIEVALNNLINSSESERKLNQEKMLSHDLKKGRERIKNLLDSLD